MWSDAVQCMDGWKGTIQLNPINPESLVLESTSEARNTSRGSLRKTEGHLQVLH